MSASKGVVLVAGVGSGLGMGIARSFASAGYGVALGARKAERLDAFVGEISALGGDAIACPMDVRDIASIKAALNKAGELGPVVSGVFNTGAQYRQPGLDITPEMFEKVWRLGCYAGLLFAQATIGRLLEIGGGSMLFTGATASLRGGAEFAAFASAKAGLRSVAQSFAREFGPKGVHVAHVVVDGLIDSEAIRTRFADAAAKMPPDGMLSPDEIGKAYVQLHEQHRSAWSFELDLRPYSERF